MKTKLSRIALLAGLMFLVVLTMPGFAQCKHQQKEGNSCCMTGKIPNLSAEQKDQIMKICAEQMKAMTPLKEALAKEHKEMVELMKNPTDQAAIEAKIDVIAKAKADLHKKCLACCLSVRQLLTDEQKAKFSEFCCGSEKGMGCMAMGKGCGMGMKADKAQGCAAARGCSKECPLKKDN